MATLAAYDPGHGIHPWSWMKTSLSGHSFRGLTVAQNHRKTSLPSEYPSIVGFHPCLAWRYALLQAARTFEQGASKEKTTHSEGHVYLTKVGNPSSPGSAESCRQMPVIKGEKTLQTCKDQQCVRSWS